MQDSKVKRCNFVGIDLATRVVVGLKEGSIQVNDLVKCLEVILEARSFKVEIVHSDRESLFGNTRYYEFLQSNSVEPSLALKAINSHRRWLWLGITTNKTGLDFAGGLAWLTF